MVAELIIGIVEALVAIGTTIGTSVASNKQTDQLAEESRKLGQQQRLDQLLAESIKQGQAQQQIDLSKEGLEFQKLEAAKGRKERESIRQEQKRQIGVERAMSLLPGKTDLQNRIVNLWSHFGYGGKKSSSPSPGPLSLGGYNA